jgi:hypothetical protein
VNVSIVMIEPPKAFRFQREDMHFTDQHHDCVGSSDARPSFLVGLRIRCIPR